mmetsp:Transcript_86111/g.240795  ORF Transcript_86111/g.240795 Transcript_86111/m.240795 type:complete len:215 (-) Transcript_86111:292-936(-)
MNWTNMGFDFASPGLRRMALLVFALYDHSPHNTFCNASGFAPIFAATKLAKVSIRNAQPWYAEPNATFPRSGEYLHASSVAMSYSNSSALVKSMPSPSLLVAASLALGASASLAINSSDKSCELTALISSTILRSRSYASIGVSSSSTMSLSTLFKKRQVFTRSRQACRSTVRVCASTPSTTSTRISAPSAKRAAVDTSEVKSTWPGESIRFTM